MIPYENYYKSKIQVLGRIVTSEDFRTPEPHRVAVILELYDHLEPKLQVSFFIGLLIYNRSYIPKLSILLASLYDLDRVMEN